MTAIKLVSTFFRNRWKGIKELINCTKVAVTGKMGVISYSNGQVTDNYDESRAYERCSSCNSFLSNHDPFCKTCGQANRDYTIDVNVGRTMLIGGTAGILISAVASWFAVTEIGAYTASEWIFDMEGIAQMLGVLGFLVGVGFSSAEGDDEGCIVPILGGFITAGAMYWIGLQIAHAIEHVVQYSGYIIGAGVSVIVFILFANTLSAVGRRQRNRIYSEISERQETARNECAKGRIRTLDASIKRIEADVESIRAKFEALPKSSRAPNVKHDFEKAMRNLESEKRETILARESLLQEDWLHQLELVATSPGNKLEEYEDLYLQGLELKDGAVEFSEIDDRYTEFLRLTDVLITDSKHLNFEEEITRVNTRVNVRSGQDTQDVQASADLLAALAELGHLTKSQRGDFLVFDELLFKSGNQSSK